MTTIIVFIHMNSAYKNAMSLLTFNVYIPILSLTRSSIIYTNTHIGTMLSIDMLFDFRRRYQH